MAVDLRSARAGGWFGAVALSALACAPGRGAMPDGAGGAAGAEDARVELDVQPAATTCEKVDLVFAIDASGSMGDEQQAMGKVIFPAFAWKLRSLSKNLKDFRVAVLDSCANPVSFHTHGRSGACSFWGGKPWIESASPTMVAEFACVGEILKHKCYVPAGAEDTAEAGCSAAAASLEPAWTGPGRPNEGFLRKDAVLVVLAMTDEDEQPTPEQTAMQVYERILALKENPRHIVFLGIAGSKTCSGVYGTAAEAVKMQDLVKLFEAQKRGYFWDLCAGSLEAGLERALASIKEACDRFTVPGGDR